MDAMNSVELIRTRKSVRTFDGRVISQEDREKLCSFIDTIRNPYDIPVTFVLLDAAENGLSSPVINGEHLYIAAKVPKVPHCEEAFGYSFEQMVLYAWSLGIGITWIGGTMKRDIFEKAACATDDEFMMIVSPLGYPAQERAEVDIKLRNSVHGDERIPYSEMFFENNFMSPLTEQIDALEAIRWYPSAANMQPCRVVKVGNVFHFYEKHTMGYKAKVAWNVQKIDLGIALCHFLCVARGEFTISDSGIPTEEDTEYIATVKM